MYTTTSYIEAKLGRSLTTAQANYFNTVLDNKIDTTINKMTRSVFGSLTPTTVYVDGTGTGLLIIPTMNNITAVAKDDNNSGTYTDLAADTYRVLPLAEVNKYAIRVTTGTWFIGTENYKITGILGYEDIPADIIDVATSMAIDSLTNNITNYKSERVGDWAVTYADVNKTLSADQMQIFDNYKRLSRSI